MSGKKRDRDTLKDENREEATVSELFERFESCSGSPSPEQYTAPKQLRRDAAPSNKHTAMASDPVLDGQAAILKSIADMSKHFNERFEKQAQRQMKYEMKLDPTIKRCNIESLRWKRKT